MTLLRNTSLAVILSTSLVMGACSNKDKGPSAEKSAPAKALGLKAPSDKVFAKHFEVPSRKVSEAEGKQALGELNLLDESGDALSWAKSSGKNGNYSYTNLSAKDGDGQMTIAKAELVGVHMDGDVATFDRADFSGIKIYDETEDVTVTLETLSVARPTPDMAKAIITSLQNIKELDDLDIDTDDEDMGFGALGMSGMKITSKDVNLTADSLMWGEDEATNLMDFKVSDVSFNLTEKADEPMTGSLKSLSATGIRGDMFDNLPDGRNNPMSMVGGFNPLAKMYSTFKMEDLNFDSNYVEITSKGFEGKATEKGGVTTQKSVGDPFIIRLKEAPKSREAKQAYDMVKELGFDELVFQTSQTMVMDSNKDTLAVKDGLFSMKNGFKVSYNYGATGLKAMTDTIQAMDKSGKNSGQGQAQIQAAIESMKLNGFQLRLEDQSIVDRGLKLAGKLRGAEPDQVKKELKVALSLAPLMAGGGLEGEMLGEMASAFGDFVENGGTLSIVMNPEDPISMAQLADYKRSKLSKSDLGFSAKAE